MRSLSICCEEANLPQDIWYANRETSILTEENKACYDAVTYYIDHLPSIRRGQGISLVGPSKSGKTYWISSILKSMITAIHEYQIDTPKYVYRCDYQHLCYLGKGSYDESAMWTFLGLKDVQFLFIDNIYQHPPQPMFLSMCHSRRDQLKTTFLGITLESGNKDLGAGHYPFQIFSDINDGIIIKKSILNELKK